MQVHTSYLVSIKVLGGEIIITSVNAVAVNHVLDILSSLSLSSKHTNIIRICFNEHETIPLFSFFIYIIHI